MKDGFFLFAVFTLVYMSAGTISLISYCIFLGSLPGAMKERSQRREKTLLQKSKGGGGGLQIFSIKLQQNHREENMTITMK